MSSAPVSPGAVAKPEVVTREVDRPRAPWRQIASGTDHKNVGVLYIVTALSALVLALTELVLMRVQLIVPQSSIIDPVIFDRLLSAYGATAIVFFALPLALGFATYVVPLQIGARGIAFPRLGALSYWLYLAGAITLYASFLYVAPEAGVNPLPPLSDDAFLESNGVNAWIAGVSLALLGFTLAAVNLVVTVHRNRAPGMAWRRLPLFSWASTVVGYLTLVAAPVMIAALTMLFIDRLWGGVFFESGAGGGPIFFQHLSWIFFTSAYVAVLVFAAGVISEIVPVFSGRPSFSHRAIAASLVALGTLGFFAWMQNMYTSDIAPGFLYFAMAMAVLMAIAFGTLFFNWIATLWNGALRLRAPLLFALGAISTIAFGTAGELALSIVPVAWQLDATTVAWAFTHYALVGGAVLGGFAALYYWFPKITGRTMGEGLARASFWAILVGVHTMALSMFLAGLEGQPADISFYFEGSGLFGFNLAASVGSFVLAIGILVTLANAAISSQRGVVTGHDPWGAETLEWFALSPPPIHNFDVIPDVRSEEPLRDIRRAIGERTATWSPAAAPARSPEAADVAQEPVGPAAEPPTSQATGPARSGDGDETTPVA